MKIVIRIFALLVLLSMIVFCSYSIVDSVREIQYGAHLDEYFVTHTDSAGWNDWIVERTAEIRREEIGDIISHVWAILLSVISSVFIFRGWRLEKSLEKLNKTDTAPD